MDSVAFQINHSFKSNDWVLVTEPVDKFEVNYEMSEMKSRAYLAEHNPELLQSQDRDEATADEKAFLIFRKGRTDIYRAGWFYQWKTRGCGDGLWMYRYRAFLENGNDPPGNDNTFGFAYGNVLCSIH